MSCNHSRTAVRRLCVKCGHGFQNAADDKIVVDLFCSSNVRLDGLATEHNVDTQQNLLEAFRCESTNPFSEIRPIHGE